MKNLKSRRNERGAVFVEFVIVLPFLLVFLIGMIEFGLLFYNQQVLTNASREGAERELHTQPLQTSKTSLTTIARTVL